jgi:hypothetical protein
MIFYRQFGAISRRWTKVCLLLHSQETSAIYELYHLTTLLSTTIHLPQGTTLNLSDLKSVESASQTEWNIACVHWRAVLLVQSNTVIVVTTDIEYTCKATPTRFT